jgi:hypothetical protein
MSRTMLVLAVALVIAPVLIAGLFAQVKDRSLAAVMAPAADHPTSEPSGGEKPKAEKPDSDPFGAEPAAQKPKPETKPVEKPAAKPAAGDPFAEAQDKPRPKPVTAKAKPQPAGVKVVAGPLRAGEQAILKAMEEPTAMEFVETPLTDVVAFLESKHHIPFQIDKKALDDVGIGSDTPITCTISGVSLRSALELILRPLSLAWTVKSDVLLITTPEEEDSHLVTKTYDVGDLLVPTADFPYRGRSLPTIDPDGTSSFDVQGTLPAVYGMGGMGGGEKPGDVKGAAGGGAMFNMAPYATSPRYSIESAPDFDSLIDMITSTVAPTSWDQVGGPGSIAPFGRLLVVSQKLGVHRQVESLLADIRAKRQAMPTLVLDLHWLWLDATQYGQLAGGRAAPAGRAVLSVDAKALEQLARTAPGFHGRIACSSGQLVHLASGDRRSAITSAIPVIGSGVGYQPVIQVPNAGVVLEVRPTVAPAAETALLDVRSTVTRWGKPEPTAHIGAAWPPSELKEGEQETVPVPEGSASVPVDRPVMPAHQMAATIRVPLGRPVVLGGLTFAPAEDAGLAKAAENSKQLYLIATTSVAVVEPEAAGEKKP